MGSGGNECRRLCARGNKVHEQPHATLAAPQAVQVTTSAQEAVAVMAMLAASDMTSPRVAVRVIVRVLRVVGILGAGRVHLHKAQRRICRVWCANNAARAGDRAAVAPGNLSKVRAEASKRQHNPPKDVARERDIEANTYTDREEEVQHPNCFNILRWNYGIALPRSRDPSLLCVLRGDGG